MPSCAGGRFCHVRPAAISSSVKASGRPQRINRRKGKVISCVGSVLVGVFRLGNDGHGGRRGHGLQECRSVALPDWVPARSAGFAHRFGWEPRTRGAAVGRRIDSFPTCPLMSGELLQRAVRGADVIVRDAPATQPFAGSPRKSQARFRPSSCGNSTGPGLSASPDSQARAQACR